MRQAKITVGMWVESTLDLDRGNVFRVVEAPKAVKNQIPSTSILVTPVAGDNAPFKIERRYLYPYWLQKDDMFPHSDGKNPIRWRVTDLIRKDGKRISGVAVEGQMGTGSILNISALARREFLL